MNRRLLSITIMSLLVISYVGYTNCGRVVLSKAPFFASTAGTVCTKAPANLEALKRFVFILDMSTSLGGLDPATPTTSARRVQGLKDLIDKFKDDDNFTISIGAIYSNAAGFLPDPADPQPPNLPSVQMGCRFYKPRLPTDYQDLQTALNQLDTMSRNLRGTTPYSSFFASTKSCINGDLATSDANYEVVLVTDGAPTDLSPPEVVSKVKDLITLGKPAQGNPLDPSRINLYLYFLQDITANYDASQMVYNMILAAHNAGGYRSSFMIDTGGVIDYSATNIFSKPKYVMKQIYVTNMSAAITTAGTQAQDSDGDGVPDDEERARGTDPKKYSTTGQCSDFLYLKNGNRCPSNCMDPNQRFIDSDHDGISDCDELSTGSDPVNFDSNTNFIPDGLELRIGSNPLDTGSTSVDIDDDGANTVAEAKRQTSIFIDDRNVNHRALTNVSVKRVGDQNNESCYDISVSGIQIFPTEAVPIETLAEMRHKAGGNVVKVMFLQVPEGVAVSKPSLLYYNKTFNFSEYAGGVVNNYNLNTRDFQLYVPPQP